MKRLIINADDFGMSQEVNDGIKKGIEEGIITSVSVMVNMPYYEDAITYLKKHSEISVGLHFNISEGIPISPHHDVTTLIREDNSFFYWTSLVINLLLGKVLIKEIENELSEQYKKIVGSGIKISHIDSHHHIHLFPPIFKKIMDFSKKKHVEALRYRTFNPKLLVYWLTNPPSIKQCIIISLCILNSFLNLRKKKLHEINNLFDINWDANFSEKKLIKYIQRLPEGITEIICHPAVLSQAGNPKFLAPRHIGLSILLSKKVRETIKNNNIQLVRRAK